MTNANVLWNSFSGSFQKTMRCSSSLKSRSSAVLIWSRSLMWSLPDPGDAVGIELHVGTDDGNLFGQRLSHEQAVERVFVMERQPDQPGRMGRQDGQYQEPVLLQPGVDEVLVGAVQLPFAHADLNGDPPIRRRAEQHFVGRIANRRPSRRTELRIALSAPAQCAGSD